MRFDIEGDSERLQRAIDLLDRYGFKFTVGGPMVPRSPAVQPQTESRKHPAAPEVLELEELLSRRGITLEDFSVMLAAELSRRRLSARNKKYYNERKAETSEEHKKRLRRERNARYRAKSET